MAKKQADAVYRIVDVVGVSETSWEDAGRNAVKTAAGSLRDLRVAEVTKMDMKVENGKVAAFRTRVALSFKYEARGRTLGIRKRHRPDRVLGGRRLAVTARGRYQGVSHPPSNAWGRRNWSGDTRRYSRSFGLSASLASPPCGEWKA